MHDPQMSHDKFSPNFLNSIRNSNKLRNPAATSSGESFSLSTVAAEFFIFVVLRVLSQFFISHDV